MSLPLQSKYISLEERTFDFAKKCRQFISSLSTNIKNSPDINQLLRSSGSVGANYIEANESLGKKDFFMKIKICRKEAKESYYWLRLIEVNKESEEFKEKLMNEAKELTLIFNAIANKQNKLI